MAKIIQDEFATFLAECYPETPAESSDDYRQLRNAFYAGALTGAEAVQVRPLDLIAEFNDYVRAKKMADVAAALTAALKPRN